MTFSTILSVFNGLLPCSFLRFAEETLRNSFRNPFYVFQFEVIQFLGEAINRWLVLTVFLKLFFLLLSSATSGFYTLCHTLYIRICIFFETLYNRPTIDVTSTGAAVLFL